MNDLPAAIMMKSQRCYALETTHARIWITESGGMLGPATFRLPGAGMVDPYAIAPWHEDVDVRNRSLIGPLRGDFFCSAFGDNVESDSTDPAVPPHGDTAHARWEPVYIRDSKAGASLRIRAAMPTQGGFCIATTVLLAEHTFVYQRHDVHGGSGILTPGHHAMLDCSSRNGRARLSLSRTFLIRSAPHRPRDPIAADSRRLLPDTRAATLSSLPRLDGRHLDASVFPGIDELDDQFIACASPVEEFAWTAARMESGFAWISIRNRAQLPSTLIWRANGGLKSPPWNARFKQILGLEDICAYYSNGLKASSADNALSEAGIPTHMIRSPAQCIRIPYIQGVVAVPDTFDEVSEVDFSREGFLVIKSTAGEAVEVRCCWEFLRTPQLPYLCELA